MKTLLAILLVSVALAKPANIDRSIKNKQAFLLAMREAKRLMSLGQRRLSLLELDRASQSVTSRSQTAEVAQSRKIFVEQFLTSDSFQRFQEVKASFENEHYEEAMRDLSLIDARDQDNIFVAKLRAQILFKQKLFDQTEKAVSAILALMPNDADAQFMAIELAYERKQFADGLERLRTLSPSELRGSERFVILSAKLHAGSGDYDGAVSILKSDHEKTLDHIEVIYELGMLYSQVESNLWPARKALSLFISRCKRLKSDDPKRRSLDDKLKAAQSQLDLIDKKLGV